MNYIFVHKLGNKIFICWWCTVQTWRTHHPYSFFSCAWQPETIFWSYI